ncbi:MAG TPA: copper homeostasis protein CutC [Rhodanobacteraceae bacterium]|jgi:copper homeostasis protein|nr:copper homeostasis protein CutC [Rhodanobacteraceae bacterium]
MTDTPLLEIAANSLASALAAQEAGAARVELFASLGEGGVTPSYATIALARDRLRIPLYALIRPRAGDFLYNDFELETMIGDIEACARLGCDGVVIGALDEDGNVALAECRTLIAAAGTLAVTFHRAFDLARDPRSALEDVVALGCARVLTSGQAETAPAGTELIRELVDQSAQRIVIMPGGGIDADNIGDLKLKTGATEFHASAKRTLASGMHHRPQRLRDMQSGETRSDGNQIRRMLQALAGTSRKSVG